MNKQNDQQPEAVPNTANNLNNSKTDKSRAETPKASAKATSKGNSTTNKSLIIAGLAVFVAIIGSGSAIGFTVWKTQNYDNQLTTQASLVGQLKTQQSAAQQANDQAREQQTLLKNLLANEQNKVAELSTQLTTLKASQQIVIDKVAKLSTDSSQTWMLFEAKQLLKQTFLRLRVADITGASKLLEDVNNTIKQRGDLSQAASQINQAIEAALLKLQQVEQIDRANLYSQLAALLEQVNQLEAKKPVFNTQPNQPTDQNASRWDKLSNTLSGYVRVDFNANSKVLPLLTAQGVGQLKMALSLSIEKAQWAALNGEAAIYTAELDRTAQLITEYFDTKHQEVIALIDKIDELKAKTVITKVPDITDTLLLVNNYLDEQINPRSATQSAKKGGNE